MVRAFAFAAALAAIVAGDANAADRSGSSPKPHGKPMSVSGHLSVLGEIATLDGSSNGQSILVDLSTLPREQRSAITAKCSPTCDVQITGVGGRVLNSSGVLATNLAVADEDASPKLASR